MATEFSAVYDSFLGKITDPDLADMVEEDANSVMFDLLKTAIVKFGESCKTSLVYNAETGFEEDLADDEIDILSELMVEAWYKPHANFLELLRPKLSTKDFTTFSPANLQKENRESYILAHQAARSMINEYSFRHNDIGELKK